jgi:hypothetical protein
MPLLLHKIRIDSTCSFCCGNNHLRLIAGGVIGMDRVKKESLPEYSFGRAFF